MRTSEPLIILKQVFLLLASVSALYAAISGLAFLVLPPPKPTDAINTFRADYTIYMTPAKQVYYGRRALREPGRKIILIGSSNTQVGFNQVRLQSEFPDYAVHNLGIGDCNITEELQVLQLAMATMSDEDVRNSVFVIGVWYAMFIDNQTRWKPAKGERYETDIDRERFRYGFWKRSPEGPVQFISERDTDRAALLIHPLIALEKSARVMTEDLRSRIFVRPLVIDEKVRNTSIFTEDQRASSASYRHSYMENKALTDEQYKELAKFIRQVTSRGAKVIVADLPIPEWHQKAVPFDAQHRQKMAGFVAANASLPGYSYVDLHALNENDSYYDDAHVRPRAQGPWISMLRDEIRRVAPSANALTPK